MGIEDSINLYHYLFNNPFRYVDPDGQFVIPLFITLFELALPTFTIALPTMSQVCMVGAFALAATAGYEIAKKANEWDERRLDNPMLAIGVEEESPTTTSKDESKKRHTPNQEALNDLVKGTGKKGVSNTDADTLLDWAKEYNFPARDDRDKPIHWVGGEHIHIGPRHVPVYD